MQTESTQPITHIYFNGKLTECPPDTTDMGAVSLFLSLEEYVGLSKSSFDISYVNRRTGNVMVFVAMPNIHTDRATYDLAMERLNEACDDINCYFTEATLAKLNVVTVHEKDGVFLAELIAVVKHGKRPHYFNAAAMTEREARTSLMMRLGSACSLMRDIGADKDLTNNIFNIFSEISVENRRQLEDTLKAQVSIAMGTDADGGAS